MRLSDTRREKEWHARVSGINENITFLLASFLSLSWQRHRKNKRYFFREGISFGDRTPRILGHEGSPVAVRNVRSASVHDERRKDYNASGIHDDGNLAVICRGTLLKSGLFCRKIRFGRIARCHGGVMLGVFFRSIESARRGIASRGCRIRNYIQRAVLHVHVIERTPNRDIRRRYLAVEILRVLFPRIHSAIQPPSVTLPDDTRIATHPQRVVA